MASGEKTWQIGSWIQSSSDNVSPRSTQSVTLCDMILYFTNEKALDEMMLNFHNMNSWSCRVYRTQIPKFITLLRRWTQHDMTAMVYLLLKTQGSTYATAWCPWASNSASEASVLWWNFLLNHLYWICKSLNIRQVTLLGCVKPWDFEKNYAKY